MALINGIEMAGAIFMISYTAVGPISKLDSHHKNSPRIKLMQGLAHYTDAENKLTIQ